MYFSFLKKLAQSLNQSSQGIWFKTFYLYSFWHEGYVLSLIKINVLAIFWACNLMTHNKSWSANCIVCIDDFYSNVLLFIAPEITRSRLTTFMTIIAIFKLTHTHTHNPNKHIHRGTYISIALPGLMVS